MNRTARRVAVIAALAIAALTLGLPASAISLDHTRTRVVPATTVAAPVDPTSTAPARETRPGAAEAGWVAAVIAVGVSAVTVTMLMLRRRRARLDDS